MTASRNSFLFWVGFAVAILTGPAAASPARAEEPQDYEVVIRNGRVMDPESRLDAIRSVGISDGVIKAIDSELLTGRLEIDATGLVVAPGFIDAMWDLPQSYQGVQLLDGVTTALKLWVGTADVDR